MTTSALPRRREREDAATATLRMGIERWSALGTSVQVLVTDRDRIETAVTAVRSVLTEVDEAASRFRADSGLSEVNRRAGHWVTISELLCHAIRTALDAAAFTDGAVDPTVGAALIDLGYDRTFRLVPIDGPPVPVRIASVAGWQQVEVDDGNARVRIPAGTLLDLGATAKGLAADLAATKATATADCGVLVNLGGDIAVAGGPPAEGWAIAIADRTDPDALSVPADPAGPPLQTVVVRGGGLATSSTTARRWRRGGSVVHHILDPRSGRPADSPWRTISVTAACCVLANTASTAGIVMGASAPSWLRKHGFAARLVHRDGSVVTIGGWPRPDGDRQRS